MFPGCLNAFCQDAIKFTTVRRTRQLCRSIPYSINCCPLTYFFFNSQKRNLTLTGSRLQQVQEDGEQSQPAEVWDIVVSGGGLVGSAMACALGYSSVLLDKKILMLETGPPFSQKPLSEKYSNRVFALTPATRDLLNSFGAWDNICSVRLKPVKRMQVWEACSDARISFQHPGMLHDIAYIVENEVILGGVMEQLAKIPDRVTVLNHAKVTEYLLPKQDGINEWVEIKLENGQKLKTKLLIGADGMRSLVRKTMNVNYTAWNYDQKAIVATLKLSESTENSVAWQRFISTGPIALLPLSDDQSSLVWTATSELADQLMAMPEDNFVDALNSAIWDESKKNPIVEKALGTLNGFLNTLWPGEGNVQQLPPNIISIDEGSRAYFPLGLGHAAHYVASRVALVGDAAHRIHPLAGQGVNLGFGDVHTLTRLLGNSVYNGNDIGTLEPLLEYETERQRHVVPTMCVIDGLNRLYSTDLLPVVLLRSLGLHLTDTFRPIKERIISHASS